MDSHYDALCYPHSLHRRYVRGCVQCLERTRAGQARYTESKRRMRESNARRAAEYLAKKGGADVPNP